MKANETILLSNDGRQTKQRKENRMIKRQIVFGIMVSTLLGIAITGLVMQPQKAKSFPTPLYRCMFQPEPGCIVQCFRHTADGYDIPIPFAPPETVQILTSDVLNISVTPACCSCTTCNGSVVGHQWEEVSYDNGSTWTMITPTYLETKVPKGISWERFKPVNYQLTPWQDITQCGQTG